MSRVAEKDDAGAPAPTVFKDTSVEPLPDLMSVLPEDGEGAQKERSAATDLEKVRREEWAQKRRGDDGVGGP